MPQLSSCFTLISSILVLQAHSWPAPLLPRGYLCFQKGQGEAWVSYLSAKVPEENCQQLCDQSSECVGYDWSANEHDDACRLYKANTPRLGDSGFDHRKYCAKRSHFPKASENEVNKADDFCDWINIHVGSWVATSEVYEHDQSKKNNIGSGSVSLQDISCSYPFQASKKTYRILAHTNQWQTLPDWGKMLNAEFSVDLSKHDFTNMLKTDGSPLVIPAHYKTTSVENEAKLVFLSPSSIQIYDERGRGLEFNATTKLEIQV